MIRDEAYYISNCRALIEEKLSWGKSADWQNQDFENLSEKIFEETKVSLSSSTLKRIWGKVRYESSPNMSTLDALAQFSGHSNWRTFISNSSLSLERKRDIIAAPALQFLSKKRIFIIFAPLLIVFIGFWLLKNQTKHLIVGHIRFSSKPITLGLPNTVIFQYDASDSNADSVFIQQSWDRGKRFKVDKQLHKYTSTYYFPGYYRAKLILDDSIVKEHDVYIETGGWVGIIDKHPVPVYLSRELFQNQYPMGISEKELVDQKIDFEKETPVFILAKVDKGIDLPSENLFLRVQLQNTYTKSNGICRRTNITLFGTNGVIDIPLSNIGCVGEIGLMIGIKYIDGKTNDLSGFGIDFKEYAIVSCETKNQMIKIFVNGKIAYSGDYRQDIGRIVGAKIRFTGTGVVKEFELREGK